MKQRISELLYLSQTEKQQNRKSGYCLFNHLWWSGIPYYYGNVLHLYDISLCLLSRFLLPTYIGRITDIYRQYCRQLSTILPTIVGKQIVTTGFQ
jgi:hypothetical protein